MKETTSRQPPSHHWYLIRGLIRESGHWGNFPRLFGSSFGGGQVHCLDLPGTGVHFQRKSPLSLTQIVRATRKEFLVHEAYLRREWGDPIAPRYVFALSLGGMLALKWIAQFPDDFAKGVLLNTSLPSISPFFERLQFNAVVEGIRGLASAGVEERERAILDLTSNRPCRRERALPEWVSIQKSHPVSGENLVRQMVAAVTVGVPRMPKQFPILLLNSEKDRIVDPACSVALQKKWKWDLRRHPLAGHDLTLDDPEWVVRQVRQWLDKEPVQGLAQ